MGSYQCMQVCCPTSWPPSQFYNRFYRINDLTWLQEEFHMKSLAFVFEECEFSLLRLDTKAWEHDLSRTETEPNFTKGF